MYFNARKKLGLDLQTAADLYRSYFICFRQWYGLPSQVEFDRPFPIGIRQRVIFDVAPRAETGPFTELIVAAF